MFRTLQDFGARTARQEDCRRSVSGGGQRGGSVRFPLEKGSRKGYNFTANFLSAQSE